MVRKQFYFLVSVVALTSFFSCKYSNAVSNNNNTPKTLIQGAWIVTKATEKTLDESGKVVRKTDIPLDSPAPIVSLASNGTYQAGSSTGTWQLSADNSKLIYDKGRSDERYYINTTLTSSRWVAEGPYTPDGKLYLYDKKYEYSHKK